MSLPETLTQARQQASPDPARALSFRAIRDKVKPLLLEHTPTEETLRALHTPGLCPKKPDPLVVWALATIYDLDMGDLDRVAAEALDNIIEISESRRRHPQPGHARPAKKTTRDQVNHSSTWTLDIADQPHSTRVATRNEVEERVAA